MQVWCDTCKKWVNKDEVGGEWFTVRMVSGTFFECGDCAKKREAKKQGK